MKAINFKTGRRSADRDQVMEDMLEAVSPVGGYALPVVILDEIGTNCV